MARLRAPDGCPWDQEQTHQSIARCLVEEAAEVLEAIDTENSELLREELGDLLLQVVFHAQIEEEAGRFDLEDVAREISEKLVRRHPHVFGDPDDKEEDANAVIDRWEKIKAEEKKPEGKMIPINYLRNYLPSYQQLSMRINLTSRYAS